MTTASRSSTTCTTRSPRAKIRPPNWPTPAHLIGYVQFADVVGRGEPGSGSIDWPAALNTLKAAGYDGPIGLEYFPTQPTTASVEYIRSVAAAG